MPVLNKTLNKTKPLPSFFSFAPYSNIGSGSVQRLLQLNASTVYSQNVWLIIMNKSLDNTLEFHNIFC